MDTPISFAVGTIVELEDPADDAPPKDEDIGYVVSHALMTPDGILYNLNGDTDYEYEDGELVFKAAPTEDSLAVAMALTDAFENEPSDDDTDDDGDDTDIDTDGDSDDEDEDDEND